MKSSHLTLRLASSVILVLAVLCSVLSDPKPITVSIRPIGTYSAGVFNAGGAEIVDSQAASSDRQ